MKSLSSLLILSFLAAGAAASETDTLRNHAAGVALVSDRYTGPGEWGYLIGHNSERQQQFAERYDIEGHGHVIGIAAHFTGVVANEDKEVFFRLYSVQDGKPGTELEHGHMDLGDIDLSGGPSVALFHEEGHADGSFFVTVDFGDYAHDGLNGDTLGILYAADGSREAADLDVPYRNVAQEHSHGAESWSDVHQTLSLATHLAIYPIIEAEDHGHETGVQITKGGMSLKAPYPNPAGNNIFIPFSVEKKTELTIYAYDMSGKTMQVVSRGEVYPGAYTESLDIAAWPGGMYLVVVRTSHGSLAARITKNG